MKNKRIIIPVIVLSLLVVVTICIVTLTNPTDNKRFQKQMDMGQRYLSEMNYEQAIAAYRAAIELDPNNAAAYLGLAEVYIAMGKQDMAGQVLQEGYAKTQDERLSAKQLEVEQLILNASKDPSSETEAATGSTETGNTETAEGGITVDVNALLAVEDDDERYILAQEMMEILKNDPNANPDDSLNILRIIAECKAEPFGEEAYINELKNKFDELLDECKGTYCTATRTDNDFVTLTVYDANGDIIVNIKNWGTDQEESIRHYYDNSGRFLYSEKIKNGEKQQGPVYQYDAKGRLVKASFLGDKTKWYDKNNYTNIFDDSETDSIQLEYNANGDLSSLKWKSNMDWDELYDMYAEDGVQKRMNSQWNFIYRNDGYLKEPVYAAWTVGDYQSPWVYVCSDEETGYDVVDHANYNMVYAIYPIHPTIKDTDQLKIELRLTKAGDSFRQYELYAVNKANGAEDGTGSSNAWDGKYHLPSKKLSGSRFSSTTTAQDLGDGLTYCLCSNFNYIPQVSVYNMEKTLVYKLEVVLD